MEKNKIKNLGWECEALTSYTSTTKKKGKKINFQKIKKVINHRIDGYVEKQYGAV
jgi:hypothetical protein